jgi:hypothetical protein
MSISTVHKKNVQRPHLEKGQAIVLIALGMVALIGVIGLAIDTTLIYKSKQDLQRAVDSTALAAAYKLPNKTVATQAAYEFMRLHGYNFDPVSDPLQISFPVYNPARKAVIVKGSTNADLAFMRVFGFQTIKVSAEGEGESAPLDVYLVLDMSESMTYDTYYTQKPSPLPACGWSYQSDCIAKWCNAARKCDPLDLHIKPAAKFFIDQLDPTFDRVGIVVYDQFGTKIIGLSNDFAAVKAAINNLNAFDHQSTSNCDNTSPAGKCNKNTNIGDGIMVAHTNIATEGRMEAIWSIVLETDGRTNIWRDCSGCPPSCGVPACQTLFGCWSKDDCTDKPNPIYDAENWAIDNAKDTWTRHETVIYTIAYGDIFFTDPANRALMIDIADWTDNGTFDSKTDNFWAVPDEAGLRVALAEIAQRIYARLLH